MRRRVVLSSIALAVTSLGGCNDPGAETAAKDRHTGTLLWDGHAVPIEFEEIDGEHVFEGDILLDPGIVPELAEPAGRRDGAIGSTARGLAARSDRLWPGGVIPYTFADTLPAPDRVLRAMAHWESKTAIRFVERTDEASFVTFRGAAGCSSYIGRVGGQQFVNLGPGCLFRAVVHEIAHAVGAPHEHTRADRDDHVVVHWENIIDGNEGQFRKAALPVPVTPYDDDSIVHYGSYVFSKNGRPTVTRLDGSLIVHEAYPGLTPTDVAGIEALYGPNEPPDEPELEPEPDGDPEPDAGAAPADAAALEEGDDGAAAPAGDAVGGCQVASPARHRRW